MAATIIAFVKDVSFGPETVASMGEAFDRACAATAALGQPAIHRAIIAKRIIELAKAGEQHPQILCNRALQTLRQPYALVDVRWPFLRRGAFDLYRAQGLPPTPASRSEVHRWTVWRPGRCPVRAK